MQIKSFWGGVQAELKKATWPTKAELKGSAWVVVISMIILGIFVGIIDFIVSRLVSLLFHI